MSRVAVFKTVPFKRDSENVVWFNSRESQQDYFASLGGKSSFSALFASFPETNFIPMTDTLARIVIDSNDIGGILLDSLNYQYIIVEWTYNGITKYLYYFITDVKSKNIRTYEYSLELDIFNTYLRGVDWDLPNVIPVERTHISRYTYYDNTLLYNQNKYALNSDFNPPPKKVRTVRRINVSDIDINNKQPTWAYVIIKTNNGEVPFSVTHDNSLDDNKIFYSSYVNNRERLEYYSPYLVIVFLLNGENYYKYEGQSYHLHGRTIYGLIQENLSAYIVNIFTSRLQPKQLANCSYTLGTNFQFIDVTFTSTAEWSASGFAHAMGGPGLFFYGELLGRFTYNYISDSAIEIENEQTVSKYAKYEFDPSILNYETLKISYQGKEIPYNKLRLGIGATSITDYCVLTDNGICEALYLKGQSNYYGKEGESGLRASVNNKIDLPSVSDPYNNWLANNKNYGVTSYLLPSLSFGMAGLSAALMPHLAPLIAFGGAVSLVNNLIGGMIERENIREKPDDVRGNSFEMGSLLTRYDTLECYVYDEVALDNYRESLLNNMYLFGYLCNTLMDKSEVFNRYKFNFLKTMENISDRIIVNTSISNSILDSISQKYMNGIREWKVTAIEDNSNPFNYGHDEIDKVENWEESIFDSLPA